VLNPPTLRKYDVDNFNKALFDALSHGQFWLDDEQVDKLIVTKGVKIKGGNIQVKVSLL
jgi:crossover junction endodeoxyribonuclease RusA